jgi:SAM-dependent methyltransferase
MLPVLAPHCARADGIEPVPVLARMARKACRDSANVRIHRTDGRDLSAFAAGAYDVILALDSFPYLVAAGLADRHVAEAARVLTPGGDLVIVNWSYDHDAATDRAALRALAGRHGFRVLRCGGRPFTTWDGELFHLRRRLR